MRTIKYYKNLIVYLIPVILVVGVVAGAGIWLLNVEVPVEYDEPYKISMSQNEIGPDYEWETLQFRESSTTNTAYFNDTGSGLLYHQYVKIENPTGGANVNIIAEIKEPAGFNDQMGFTVLNGIVEPGEAGEAEVEQWGNINTGDIPVAAGETKKITVIYTLGNDVPASNSYSVNWDFSEGESITVSSGESIQSAIDSATGTAIFVESGTYEEQITIDKEIALVGIGNTKPVIKMPSNPDEAVQIDGSDKNWAPVILAQGNTGDSMEITIDNFEINGANFEPNKRAAGVLLQNISGTIKNLKIHNFNLNRETFGIQAYADCDLTIKNNQISEVGRGGIGVNGDGSYACISSNEVDAPVDTSWAVNCIQIGFGASGNVLNNIVKNTYWEGGDWGASGILLYDAKNVELVKENNIKNNELGFASYNTAVGEVKDNTFDGNEYHVVDYSEDLDLDTILEENNFVKNALVIGDTIRDADVSDGESIQNAIDSASEGDTIVVGPGTYEETLKINKKGLTLLGPNAGIDGASSERSDEAVIRGGTVEIQANDVTIDGFKVHKATKGTNDRAIGPQDSSGATIKNNIIANSYRGIQGDWHGRPSDLTIIGNYFAPSIDYGIAGTEDMTGLRIEDNTFDGQTEGIGLGTGVQLVDQDGNEITEDYVTYLKNVNTFTGCTNDVVDYR